MLLFVYLYSVFFQHAHLTPIVGVEKEAHTNWSMVTCVGVNDSVTVSSAWELTSVSMHYSQENGVHIPLSRLVLYPRSVCVFVIGVYKCYIGLPSARLCAVLDENNKRHVCTPSIKLQG